MILLRVTGCRTDDPLPKLERSYGSGLLGLAAERLDIPLCVPEVKLEHPKAAKVKKLLLRRVRKVDSRSPLDVRRYLEDAWVDCGHCNSLARRLRRLTLFSTGG
ncbi:hypothetical protein [Methanopyrus sp. KOL6]|uniref:hypothetical protein n=1 Tax=Methanopyrus sp. KOL6 TaxID=1937004 RepID=UPI0012FC084E|nr:hypothetical protein [Methanopyrus sp. KOL6]